MSAQPISDFYAYPDAAGHFGKFGGRFVAETLIGPLQELSAAYDQARQDPSFIAEYDKDLKHYVGRPSPIYHAERLSREVGGAQILLKREDLNHTGAHKINNTIGQALLASRMGKTRIIAETGAGQHGVASATVAARLGLECLVYMGATDIERQKINVYRMKLLGATVIPVTSGSATLRTRSTKRCATGSPTCATPSTSSAPWPALTRIRAWCVTSTRLSAASRARRCWKTTAVCRMRSAPASVAVAMRSACSMPSSTTRASRSMAPGGRRRHRYRPPCGIDRRRAPVCCMAIAPM